jgi:hypothetical protein
VQTPPFAFPLFPAPGDSTQFWVGGAGFFEGFFYCGFLWFVRGDARVVLVRRGNA